jgi:hypothetical protein
MAASSLFAPHEYSPSRLKAEMAGPSTEPHASASTRIFAPGDARDGSIL